jgi:hypothetical protein
MVTMTKAASAIEGVDMRRAIRVMMTGAATGLVLGVVGGCGEVEGEEPEALEAIERDEGNPDDLRTVPVVELLDGVAVATPPPGMRVLVEVIYEDGRMELADVSTDDDGEVALRFHDDEWGLVAPTPTTEACPSKCTDDRSSLSGHHWTTTLSWRYRDAGRPAALDMAATVAALRHGASGPPMARDACSLPDAVSATQSYLGSTNTAPNISVNGAGDILCASTDGNNVIGWSNLPGSTLGVTCTWSYNTGQAVESDMLYDSSVPWYTSNTAPAGCWNQFSLRGVATHEFGHAFGLGHSPGDSCNLTMYPSTGPCNDGARSFGLGDVEGLESLY